MTLQKYDKHGNLVDVTDEMNIALLNKLQPYAALVREGKCIL